MFAHVLPFHNSLGDEGFPYFVPEHMEESIHVGTLVAFPLRKKVYEGLVLSLQADPPQQEKIYEYKSLVYPVSSRPLLQSSQIGLLHFLSKYYFIPLHKLIFLFLGKDIFRRLARTNYTDLPEFTLNKILNNNIYSSQDRFLFSYEIKKHNQIFGRISDFLDEHKDQKVACLFHSDQILEKYKSFFLSQKTKNKKTGVFIPRLLTPLKKYMAYLSGLKQEWHHIYGTRNLLFAPLQDFHILYIEDIFAAHTYINQQQKIHHMHILSYFAHTNTPVHILTSHPSISGLALTKKEFQDIFF